MGNSQTNEKTPKTGKSPTKSKHFIRNLNRKTQGRDSKKHGKKKSDAKRDAIDRDYDKTPDSDKIDGVYASDNDTVECVFKTLSAREESASVQSEVTVSRCPELEARSATRDEQSVASAPAPVASPSTSGSVFTDPLTPSLAVELNQCYYSAESDSAYDDPPRTLTPTPAREHSPADTEVGVMPHEDAASLLSTNDMENEEKRDVFGDDGYDKVDDEKVMGGLLSGLRGRTLERTTHECDHEFRDNRLKASPGQTSFTVSRHRKVELPPVIVDSTLNILNEGDIKRHSSVTDTPMTDSNVLRKVASLTLDKHVEFKVSRPKFVPEKLDFQLYEKFEGQMLLNWFVASVSDNNSLKQTVHSQDLKNLGIQYCTDLLAAGVLRQISDKEAPLENVFKPNLMYYWAHMELPTSQPVTPGRLHMCAWPPDKEHSPQTSQYIENNHFLNQNNNEEINDLAEAKSIIAQLKRKLQELEYQLEKHKLTAQIDLLNKNIDIFNAESKTQDKAAPWAIVDKEVQTCDFENEVNVLPNKPVINIPENDPIRTSVNRLDVSSVNKTEKGNETKPEIRSEKIENYCKLNKSRDYNKTLQKEEPKEKNEDVPNGPENAALHATNSELTTSGRTYESSSDASFCSTYTSSDLIDTLTVSDRNVSTETNLKGLVNSHDAYSAIIGKQSKTSHDSQSVPSEETNTTSNYSTSKTSQLESEKGHPVSQTDNETIVIESSDDMLASKSISKASDQDLPIPKPSTKPPKESVSPTTQASPEIQKTSSETSKEQISPAKITRNVRSPTLCAASERVTGPVPRGQPPPPPPMPEMDLAKPEMDSAPPPKPAIGPPPPPMPDLGPPPPPMPDLGPPPPPMPGSMPGIGPPPPPMSGYLSELGPPPPPMPGMGPPPPPMPGIGPPPPPMPGMGPPPPPMPGMGPPPPPMPGMGPPPPPMPGMGPPPPPMEWNGMGPPSAMSPSPLPASGPIPPPPPGGGAPLPPGPQTNRPAPFPAPPGWTMQKATLRKNPVKPAAPMKPLYWTRILANQTQAVHGEPDNSTFKPLWLEIEETSLDNIDEFTDLFSRQVVKAPVKKKVEVKTKIKPIKILDSKRSQNVGILAQSLHVEFSEIENAIYNFDTSVVSLEALQQIYELRATPEELALIKEHLKNKPDTPLDRPEAFLHDLSGISHFAERIWCFMFQAEFEDAISTTMHKLDNLKHVCEFLMTSEPLKKLFAIILTLGNYMNGGNGQRGQADGFGLEILSKLKDVKSKQSNVTLLHFIVRTYMRSCGGALASSCVLPVPEPGDVSRAAAIDFADVSASLATLQSQLAACKEKTETVINSDSESQSSDQTPNDSNKRLEVFKEKMTAFINTAEDKLKTEHENLEECRTKFVATVKFYQYTSKSGKSVECEPLEFFSLWTSFCSDFKDIFKKEEQIAIKEKLKEAKRMQGERKTVTQPKKEGGLKARLQKLSNSRKSS